MDVTVNVTEWGDFDPIDTGGLGVTGEDGYGQPTPTVRELIAILQAIPEQFQDLPVIRYVNDGVRGIQHGRHYHDEHDPEHWTEHVYMW